VPKLRYIFAFGLLLLAIGFFVGRATHRSTQTITISTIDTILVRSRDTLFVPETLYAKQDTFVIEWETPIGSIPARIIESNDSLTIDIEKQRVFIPFTLRRKLRGQDYGYDIITHPTPYKITLPAKTSTFDLFATAGFYVNQSWRISGAVEGGLSYKKHYALIGRMEVNHENETSLMVGLQYRL